VITHDGQPVRIKKAETFSDLRGTLSQELSSLIKQNNGHNNGHNAKYLQREKRGDTKETARTGG
jgi:hypothetical protein